MTGKHKKRGFSLIEAAIVLAVVGLVLGGIWVAAAAMYENYKVNKTVEGVFTTARNIQNLISIKDAVSMGNLGFSNTVSAAVFFPKDWKANPFNGFSIAGNEVYGQGAIFYIQLGLIPKKACVKLLVKLSSISNLSIKKISEDWVNSSRGGIFRLRVSNSGNNAFDNFPVDASSAAAVCEDENDVISYFNYTRIN